MNELKPCPFCGGEAKAFSFRDGATIVYCEDCEIETPMFTAMKYAIKAWNRRANDEAD